MKKFRVISLLLAMTLFLTACGGGKSSDSADNSMNRNAVFKENKDAYALEGDISQIAVVGDILYVEQYQYNYDTPQAKVETAAVVTSEIAVEETVIEEGAVQEDVFEEEFVETAPTTTRIITGFNPDGTVKNKIEKALDMRNGAGNFTADAEGNIYSIMYQYATYENGDNQDKIYLECYGTDGSDKWKIQINENVAEGEYFYANSLFCNDMNQIVMDSSRGIEIYDTQGNPIKLIEKPVVQMYHRLNLVSCCLLTVYCQNEHKDGQRVKWIGDVE